MPEKPKPQLHQSGLEMISFCGVQFYRRYINGEKIPPNGALVIGKTTHRTIDVNLQNVIDKGTLLSVEEVQDIARDTVEAEWEGGVRLDDDEIEMGIKAVKAGVIDTSVSLARHHRIEVAPTIRPIAVEKPWVVKLYGYPMDLAGQIDIDEGIRIRDTKTSGKSPAKDEADNSLQLSTYGLAKKVLTGTAPREYVLDVLVKSNPPKWVPLTTYRNEDDFKMLLARIERAIEMIQKGAFMPASPTDWGCSKKYCGYWQTCPFARRPVSVSMSSPVSER